MLLTFSKRQMMYNISYVVLCAEAICKGYLFTCCNKVNNKIKH